MEDKRSNQLIGRLVKEQELDKPGPEFMTQLLSRIDETAEPVLLSEPASPLISTWGWIMYASVFTALSIFAFFTSGSVSLTSIYQPVSEWWGAIHMPQMQLPTILGQSTLIYIVVFSVGIYLYHRKLSDSFSS